MTSLQLTICSSVFGRISYHDESLHGIHSTHLLVKFQIDTVHLTETDQIRSHQNSEFLSLLFTTRSFLHGSLVLKANP